MIITILQWIGALILAVAWLTLSVLAAITILGEIAESFTDNPSHAPTTLIVVASIITAINVTVIAG